MPLPFVREIPPIHKDGNFYIIIHLDPTSHSTCDIAGWGRTWNEAFHIRAQLREANPTHIYIATHIVDIAPTCEPRINTYI